jgi:hypothetical protein
MTVTVDTSGHIYDDFNRLLFFHDRRETSVLVIEFPEESDQLRFLHVVCLGNLKGSVRLILAKTSAMRISIPLDLSSWSFIPLPRFFSSRGPNALLESSLVLLPPCSSQHVSKRHMLSVYFRNLLAFVFIIVL